MKHLTILGFFCSTYLLASQVMQVPSTRVLTGIQMFTQQPEFPHQLHNAFKAGALTQQMVEYFLRNSQQKQRARAILGIVDMVPDILFTADRLTRESATRAQIQNALAGLRLIDFLQGEREYVDAVARAESLARALKIKTPVAAS